MVLLSVTKLIGFFGDLHNDLELISLRLSVLWLNLLQSTLFCLWLSPVPGLCINWMSTMLSCKEICLKLFTVPRLQALRTPLTQIMCAGLIDLSTVLSRLPVHGTADLLGFVEAKTDASLFVHHHGKDMAYLLLYVDDIILTASSDALLRRLTDALQQEFSMKDLSPSSFSWHGGSALQQWAFPLSAPICD